MRSSDSLLLDIFHHPLQHQQTYPTYLPKFLIGFLPYMHEVSQSRLIFQTDIF